MHIYAHEPSVRAILLGLALAACGETGPTEPQSITVDGRLALAALVSISDGHLRQIADQLQLLAASEQGRTADWEQIRAPLGAIEQMNVRSLAWFARSDGVYWSVQNGVASGNLSDRAYWPRLMAGRTVIGDLVTSKATGKSSAIVAVPIRGGDGTVLGVLGSSVFLDTLSLLIKQEIDLQPDQIFFSIDATPIGALQDDPSQIFLDPYALGEPDLERAIREMLTKDEGVVTYTFRGKRRTVLYRRSDVSGWWYAFGHVWD